MPTPAELIAQAANKKASVAEAAAAKIQKFSAQDAYNTAAGISTNGAGMVSASPLEQDIRTLNPSQLYGKYGDRASEILAQQAQGDRQFTRDASNAQTTGDAVADSVMGIGTGVVNSIGGIGALGLGIVDEGAGGRAAAALGSFNEWSQEQQSDTLNARRRAMAARNSMTSRDNASQFEQDKKTDGNFMATLKREGRNALDVVNNAIDDPLMLTDGIAQGVGSLLAGGPVAKVLKGVGVGAHFAMPAAIGAMEGGGAYAQTSQDVQKMSHETLMKTSPDYREMIDQGVTQEQAKQRVASRSALVAAAIQAPIGVATGALVSKFEGSPFASASLRQTGGNLLRETIEEGLQSTSGQVSQNVGQKLFANKDQDLGEGVGEQTALGALYGLGTAGAVQAPRATTLAAFAAGKKVLTAGTAAVGKTSNWVLNQSDKLTKENEKASPVADDIVQATAEAVVAQGPEVTEEIKQAIDKTEASPDQKTKANEYLAAVRSSFLLDTTTDEFKDMTPEVRDMISDAGTRPNAVRILAQQVMKSEGPAQLLFAAEMYQLMLPMVALQKADAGALNDLPENHPARGVIAEYQGLIGNIDNTPTIRKALQAAEKLINADNASIPDVTPEQLDTPAGKNIARTAVAVASMAPDKGNLATAELVLNHANEGKLNLTPVERAALSTSIGLLKARRLVDDEKARLGIQTKMDVVSEQVVTRDSVDQISKSALQHTKDVMAAMRAGNTDLAKDMLEDFGKFVQHMQNKVDALNTHLGNNNPKAPGVLYEQLMPNAARSWKMSKAGMSVRLDKPSSIQFAQTIDLETKVLSQVFNGLVEAFPSLGIPQFEFNPVDALLDGDANEVVAEFRSGRRSVVSSTGNDVSPRNDAPKEQPKVADKEVVKPTTEPTKEITPTSDEIIGEREVAVEKKLETEAAAKEQQTSAAELIAKAADEGVGVAKPANAMDAVFPNLISHVTNFFKKTFKIPETPKTRIIGTETPMAVIRDALNSNATYASFVGSNLSKSLDSNIIDAYHDLIDTLGSNIKTVMDQNLQAFLDDTYSKSFPIKMGELIRTNGEVTKKSGEKLKGADYLRVAQGKALNIVEMTDDGFQYNQELQEAAALAGVQWSISASQLEKVMDDGDIAALTGLDPATLHWSDINKFTEGMDLKEAKRSLAKKIANYWGVNASGKMDKAYAEGIPEAVAAEVLRALIADGTVQVKSYTLTEADGLPKLDSGKPNVRTIERYVVGKMDKESPIREFSDAIERAVMVEPEQTMFMGNDLPPVPKGQMNNEDVALTPDQVAAIKREQKTPFHVDKTMLSFFNAIGVDSLTELFGAGRLKDRVLNRNHQASMEGQNLNIESAFQQMQDVYKELQNTAATTGVDAGNVPIRYAYNMSRVGRMQMLGKYNPQANKLMREAFLPTWSTLDLNNPDHNRAFNLALGQAFGVKVHAMPYEQVATKVQAMLNGGLAPAVEIINEWMAGADLNDPLNALSLTADQAATIKQAFKNAEADMTVHALHGLVDAVRVSRMEDKSAVRTSLYLEADGVTNGPINAMMLMTTGQFDLNWVKNIAKGGLFFGPKRTMNEHRTDTSAEGDIDLYKTATHAAGKLLSARLSSIKDSKVLDMHRHLFTMMDLFMPDVSFDPNKEFKDNALELSRGIAKNPLTITLYGSGVDGIASKYVKQITEGIYETMSKIAAAGEDATIADAAFDGDESKAEAFVNALKMLTSFEVRRGKEGLYRTAAVMSSKPDGKPTDYTVSKEAFEAMSSNMKEMFVAPMRAAIEETVGLPLMSTVEVLRNATNVQSIYMKHAFEKAVRDALLDKQGDPEWRTGDFLSNSELGAIMKDLQKSFPLVQTNTQAFMIAKSKSLDFVDSQYGRALDGKLRTDAYAFAPDAAGVAGIPFLTIGMGDGAMMQTLANMNLEGTLKIFDGMNMPLDKINEYSQKANEAVYESWKGNPLAAVNKAYKAFLEANIVNDMTPELEKELKEALFSKADMPPPGDRQLLVDMINGLDNQTDRLAKSIEARHKVIQDMTVSVDQMAAAASPHVVGNATFDHQPSFDEVLTDLQARYTEAVKPKEPKKEEAPVAKEVEQYGTLHKSGVRILSWTALQKMGRSDKMSAAQKAIFGELMRNESVKDFKVVSGTPEQLTAFDGTTFADGVQGQINFGTKTIYLGNPSTETLVHELIHAGSMETVLRHYSDQEVDPEASEAIKRIERMMLDFRDMDETMPTEMREAFDRAQAVISIEMDNPSTEDGLAKARAVNEFMAWALTNEQITNRLKDVKAPKIVQLAKDAIKAIKQLIWGKKKALPVADDFLSNLQFNAAIVMRSQATLSQQLREGVLFHNTSFGNSDRLNRIEEAFSTKLGDYLKTVTTGPTGTTAPALSANIVRMVGDVMASVQSHGFNMNAQEASTFKMIASTLATEADIDPNAMARAQELYTHVVKNLSVESFMADPLSTNPNDRFLAQEKYDTIVGKTLMRQDGQGRSSLLPVFLALGLVNDDFRNVLSKLPMPKLEKNTDKTLDALLENNANLLMDKLSSRLPGEGNAKDVKAALDNLAEHIQEVAADRKTMADSMSEKGGGYIDKANEVVVDGLQKLSDKGMDFGKKISTNGKNKYVRALGEWTTFVSGMASEKNGPLVAESVITMMNKSNMWKPVTDFLGDLVGRTKSNENVYDMIKRTRAMIQQLRQQFRESVPRIIAEKFTREIKDEEWTSMFNVMGKTDLASLVGPMSQDDILKLFTDKAALPTAIKSLEASLKSKAGNNWTAYESKMKQLATYMNTGVVGNNLLRNATAISRLLGMKVNKGAGLDVAQIDQLVSLYALDGLSQKDKTTISSLVQEKQHDGLKFTLSYLVGQRSEEQRKVSGGRAELNHFKGYIPSNQAAGVSLVIADDNAFSDLRKKSYERVADYKGSNLDGQKTKRGYYFAPVNARAGFNQGILQNVHQTASGVDAITGFSMDMTAGRITEKAEVDFIAKRLQQEHSTNEPLMPVFDETGAVVAFERAVDPAQMERLNKNTHLAQMVGIWRGRQVEEHKAYLVNEELIEHLWNMYQKDLQISPSNKEQYVNLLDPKTYKGDAVYADAAKLFTTTTREMIHDRFGKGEFYVRKDMLNDAIGYRSATVGDAWTGNTRWSAQTQTVVRNLAMSAFGNEAYRKLVNAERVLQNFVSDARTTIVVKSVIVPVSNFASNILQLVARGVPLMSIAKGMPAKLAEIESYTKSKMRQIELEAELRAVGSNVINERKIRVELRSITDSHKRMSIWPLIEAGEFSTIADVGMTHEDVELTSGKLHSFIEKQVDKLPKGLQTMGKYGLVTRDTALFQGLQKSVQYGDFLAKAVMFDDMTKRQKLSPADALGKITEEFVNYDRLSGRTRGYFENIGLLWFYNFKIRSAKIGLSMLRSNPVHSLLSSLIPVPSIFGSTGTPIDDNILNKVISGTLDSSMGPGMGLRAPSLNPWFNLVN